MSDDKKIQKSMMGLGFKAEFGFEFYRLHIGGKNRNSERALASSKKDNKKL